MHVFVFQRKQNKRDRFEDIPDLTSAFLDKHYKNKSIKRTISYEGINFLKEYSWPGNVRELKNVIERLCLLSSTEDISLLYLFLISNSPYNASCCRECFEYEGKSLHIRSRLFF